MLLGLGGGRLGAEGPAGDESADLGSELRRAARPDLPLAQRLAIVERALAADPLDAPEEAVRAATSLLAEAEAPAARLLRAGLRAGWVDPAVRAEARERIDALLETSEPARDGASRARLAAAGWLVGRRTASAVRDVTGAWPPDDFVRGVLTDEIGFLAGPGGERIALEDAAQVQAALLQHRETALALDRAAEDDRETMQAGLDALFALGAEAVPLLLHEAELAAEAFVPGRRERATRAILVLGLLRDRRATSTLIRCMDEHEDGWVRVYAATALGDLGDPGAVVALARQITLLGDPLRDRDQWTYPGKGATNIAPEDWDTIEYYNIDAAAADALLRLGIPGAAGWIVNAVLDPMKKNHRIRVYQDAVDALERSVPSAPVAAYNVDQGLPQRAAAFRALADWWHRHRDDRDLLSHELDDADPSFRRAVRGLAAVITGTTVREKWAARASSVVLGRALTPGLLESLATAKTAGQRAELCEVLGLVRDPRAVPTLIEVLQTDRVAFVRAKAARGLAPYARSAPEARAALVQALGAPGGGELRVAAIHSLVTAPPDPDVLAAVHAWAERDAAAVAAGGTSRRTTDYDRAEKVVLLVQEGMRHWPAIEAGLGADLTIERRSWWDLTRDALDLPEYRHDPTSERGDPWARRLTREEAAEALATIREAK